MAHFLNKSVFTASINNLMNLNIRVYKIGLCLHTFLRKCYFKNTLLFKGLRSELFSKEMHITFILLISKNALKRVII